MDSSPIANPPPTPPVSPETEFTQGAETLFSLLNAEANLCLFRSVRNYHMRCAHIGCTLPIRESAGYCCSTHKTYAESAAKVRVPFHYVDSFLDEKDRERICCTLLYNRRRGLQVAVPTLEEGSVGDVFSKPPWDQPLVFPTNLRTTDFLFFMKPPHHYKSMTIGTIKLKWHSRVRFGLQVEGCEEQETVFMTRFFLDLEKQFRDDNNELYQRCKLWYLFLFESGEHSLYCLTSSLSGGAGVDPTVAREQRNKKVPPTANAPSTSTSLAPGNSGPPNQSQNSSAGQGKGNTSSTKPPMPQPQALTLKRDLSTTFFEENFKSIISESSPGVFVFEMPSEVGNLRERVNGIKLQEIFDDSHKPDQAVLRHSARATTCGHWANETQDFSSIGDGGGIAHQEIRDQVRT